MKEEKDDWEVRLKTFNEECELIEEQYIERLERDIREMNEEWK